MAPVCPKIRDIRVLLAPHIFTLNYFTTFRHSHGAQIAKCTKVCFYSLHQNYYFNPHVCMSMLTQHSTKQGHAKRRMINLKTFIPLPGSIQLCVPAHLGSKYPQSGYSLVLIQKKHFYFIEAGSNKFMLALY